MSPKREPFVDLSPVLGRDIAWLLQMRASAHPDREVVVWAPFDGRVQRWTYGELYRDVLAVAGGLRERGVEPGESVCIHLNNRPEYLLSWLALATLGAVTVATNTTASSAELEYYVTRSDAQLVITDSQLAPTAHAATRERGLLNVDSDFVPLLHADPLDQRPVEPMAVAGIQFTSGTTSLPKGVMWTHANYLWGAKVSSGHEHLRPDDRHLVYLPLFHANAQMYSVMASLWVGGSIVLMPRFSTTRFWDTAIEHEATWASMIPFSIKALRSRPVPPDHRFRRWGAPILVPGWERYFGIPMMAWWGMTETVSHGIVSDPDQPGRPLSMGNAASEYRLRIIPDADQADSMSQVGLLEIKGRRGVSMALGYLADPDADAAAWDEAGWFTTGDRVRVHPDGAIEFIDRDKDMLKVGGENVAAAEIERVISGVSSVREVAVVGKPDQMLQEVPVAFVIPEAVAAAEDEGDRLVEEIRSRCEELLASFKVPHEIRLMPELPRSALKKVAKAKLRALVGEPAPAPRTIGAPPPTRSEADAVN